MRLELEVLEAEHLPVHGVKAELDSERLNVIAGGNACGKSLIARLLYISVTRDRESASLLINGMGDVVRWRVRLASRAYSLSLIHI